MTSLLLFTFMHWRRKWQPTPVFLPGESQGQEAWWAAIYGVAQSWTRLKRRSSSRSRSRQLKLQYFGHLMRRADSLEKTLMLGKIEGKRRTGQQRMRWLDSITDSMDMTWRKLQQTPVEDQGAQCAAVHGVR